MRIRFVIGKFRGSDIRIRISKGWQLDWSLIQSFVAVVDAGSLSAAARILRTTQPTVGRHVHALESQLNVSLFRRSRRGMVPTREANDLLPAARRMAEAAAMLELSAVGQDGDLAGTVRVTSSVFVAHYVLPPILAELRREVPALSIELVPSDTTENLLFREADIAVRMYRPTQLDVVAKRVGELSIGAYAATSYLERRGRPESPDDLGDHDLVGFDWDETILRGMRAFGREASREDFAVRCDHQTAYWQLVRAGCGIGFGQTIVGDNDDAVERVLPGLPIPTMPVWLAARPELRHSPRVARVWADLERALLYLVTPHPVTPHSERG
ncbi:MAG: LysR family transcriptional regulator [Myxococcota bacterium]